MTRINPNSGTTFSAKFPQKICCISSCNMKKLVVIATLSVLSTLFLIFIGVLLYGYITSKEDTDSGKEQQCQAICDSFIFCQGDFLKEMKLSNVSDGFTKMKLMDSEKNVLAAYDEFRITNPNFTDRDLKNFSDRYFAEDPLQECELPDFNRNPEFLNGIIDIDYRNWVQRVIDLWKDLAGQVPEDVKSNPDRHSFLYVPNCFIRAGGQFTEMYYWDSYWIIRGLLVNGMTTTARGMIYNMFHLVDTVGYIPNGNRVFYIRRSQPALLSKMVEEYYKFTGDNQFLKESLPFIEKELQWWRKHRSVDVEKDGKVYKMYIFNSVCCAPRPESFKDDYENAMQLKSESDRNHFYIATVSGAESGWDFSSREMRPGLRVQNQTSLLNLDTQNIITVDINSFLQRTAAKLAEWLELTTSDYEKASQYRKIATDLFEAIEEVFWCEEDGTWYNWDLVAGSQRKQFYASNLTPLWTESANINVPRSRKVLQYLVNEKIISNQLKPLYFGIPTSKVYTGQQWDGKNMWPPLQSIVIEGLRNTDYPPATQAATELAKIWLKTNYIGYQNSKHMFEKYSAVELGVTGNGGQYEPQTGFGWTNGLCIYLFYLYGNEVTSKDYNGFVPAPMPYQ